jgi:uncharacterized integral membrane protein
MADMSAEINQKPGFPVKTVAIVILALILLIVILQNNESITLRFLFWGFSMSQILLLLLTALVGFAIGLLAYSMIERRGRREQSTRGGM